MTIPLLLAELASKGAQLSLAAGQLVQTAPSEMLTEIDIRSITTNQERIVDFLLASEAGTRPYISSTAHHNRPSINQENWWHWVKGLPPEDQERIPVVERFVNAQASTAEMAVKDLIRRHKVLQTHFLEENELLTVAFNDPDTFLVDFEKLNTESDEAAIQAKIAAFIAEPIPVWSQWLVRTKFFVMDRAGLTVVMVFNHLVFDGSSIPLISAELRAAIDDGEIPPQPVVQFYDYAAMERDWFEGPSGAVLVDYWKKWIADKEPLHAPESGLALQWQAGTRVDREFVFAAGMINRVMHTAASKMTSPFFIYMTALSVSVARWAGSKRAPLRCIGNLRTSPSLSSLIGYMVATDFVDIDIPHDRNYGPVLQAAMAEHRAAMQMRIPLVIAFPPHATRPCCAATPLPLNIATTINFISFKTRRNRDTIASTEDTLPPVVQRTSSQFWPRPFSPIYLWLLETDTSFTGKFQFNEALLTQNEQQALVDLFFHTLREMTQ